MVVIVWLLDLQLHVQAVLITAKVVSSNHVHGEMYSIEHCVIKFVSSGKTRVLEQWHLPISDITVT